MLNISYFLLLMGLGLLFTLGGLLRLYFVSGVKKKGLIVTGGITLIIWTCVSIYLAFMK